MMLSNFFNYTFILTKLLSKLDCHSFFTSPLNLDTLRSRSSSHFDDVIIVTFNKPVSVNKPWEFYFCKSSCTVNRGDFGPSKENSMFYFIISYCSSFSRIFLYILLRQYINIINDYICFYNMLSYMFFMYFFKYTKTILKLSRIGGERTIKSPINRCYNKWGCFGSDIYIMSIISHRRYNFESSMQYYFGKPYICWCVPKSPRRPWWLWTRFNRKYFRM